MSRVIVVFSLVPRLMEELSLKCPSINFQEIVVPETQGFDDSVWKKLNNADILIADPFISTYAHNLPNLKWLQLTWAGVDMIAARFQDCPAPPYLITRLGGCFGQAMSDYVLGYIIANERRFKESWKAQTEHIWLSEYGINRTLSQLSFGILGLGDIGKCIAKYCKALGMTTWAMGRTARQEIPSYIDEYRTTADLTELLKSCDYICNILPSTPDTKNLLSGNVLQVCNARQSCFINIGRGDVINEASLVNALKTGWISGAILDVFEKEPLPKDSELWDMPLVTITPHCSGPSFPKQVAEIFSTNLKLYDQGKQLDFTVDVKRGY